MLTIRSFAFKSPSLSVRCLLAQNMQHLAAFQNLVSRSDLTGPNHDCVKLLDVCYL